jgi:NAD(P) transhydrogenase subunit alpha
VAATPETVKQLAGLGLEVLVESGAGTAAGHSDNDYLQSGAWIVPDLELGGLDVYAHVRPLEPATAAALHRGAVTVGLASPSSELPTVRALADAGVTSFALELVPRISRAQSMDALTSQALVAGYRCVLEAAMRLPRFFPLYMTAAGTIPPARVLVLGAGVAGLQAIGTAKRLGARVSANDIRPDSADEVASMGGTFIKLDVETAEASGGYARELSADRGALQRQLLAPHVAQADVLITTAAVPGRRAPLLVSLEMVQHMRPGSVVIDLAAESGGNVEGSVPGRDLQIPTADGQGTVTLVGMKDAASAMPADASRLYAKNVANLLALMIRDGAVVPDFGDEVVAGACLTHDGEVRHGPTAEALEALSAETAESVGSNEGVS